MVQRGLHRRSEGRLQPSAPRRADAFVRARYCTLRWGCGGALVCGASAEGILRWLAGTET